MRTRSWYFGAMGRTKRILYNFAKYSPKREWDDAIARYKEKKILGRLGLERIQKNRRRWFNDIKPAFRDLEQASSYNMFAAENVQRWENSIKFLGLPNLSVLWEYWQKNLNRYTYLPTALSKFYEKMLPKVLATGLDHSFLPKLSKKKNLTIATFSILLNNVYSRDNENKWFRTFYSNIHTKNFKNTRIREVEFRYLFFKKWLGVKKTDEFNLTISRILKIKIQWDRLNSNYWRVKKYNKVLTVRYTNWKRVELQNNTQKVKKVVLKKIGVGVVVGSGKQEREVRGFPNKDVTNFLGNFYTPTILSSRLLGSEIVYNAIVVGRLLNYKIFKLLWTGYLCPNFRNQNTYWVFSIYRKLYKIHDFSLAVKDGGVLMRSITSKGLSYISWVAHYRKMRGVKVDNFIFGKLKTMFFLWKQLTEISTFNWRDLQTRRSRWLLSKVENLWVYKKFLNYMLRLGYTEYLIVFFTSKKGLEVPFINSTLMTKLSSSYNYDQTKDFLIQTRFHWFTNQFASAIDIYCENTYTWLDAFTLNWKEQKAILVGYRSVLRKLLQFPYTRVVPLLSTDILIILNSVQPITYLDCIYYRDYTDFFIKKTLRVFFTITNLKKFFKKTQTKQTYGRVSIFNKYQLSVENQTKFYNDIKISTGDRVALRLRRTLKKFFIKKLKHKKKRKFSKLAAIKKFIINRRKLFNSIIVLPKIKINYNALKKFKLKQNILESLVSAGYTKKCKNMTKFSNQIIKRLGTEESYVSKLSWLNYGRFGGLKTNDIFSAKTESIKPKITTKKLARRVIRGVKITALGRKIPSGDYSLVYTSKINKNIFKKEQKKHLQKLTTCKLSSILCALIAKNTELAVTTKLFYKNIKSNTSWICFKYIRPVVDFNSEIANIRVVVLSNLRKIKMITRLHITLRTFNFDVSSEKRIVHLIKFLPHLVRFGLLSTLITKPLILLLKTKILGYLFEEKRLEGVLIRIYPAVTEIIQIYYINAIFSKNYTIKLNKLVFLLFRVFSILKLNWYVDEIVRSQDLILNGFTKEKIKKNRIRGNTNSIAQKAGISDKILAISVFLTVVQLVVYITKNKIGVTVGELLKNKYQQYVAVGTYVLKNNFDTKVVWLRVGIYSLKPNNTVCDLLKNRTYFCEKQITYINGINKSKILQDSLLLWKNKKHAVLFQLKFIKKLNIKYRNKIYNRKINTDSYVKKIKKQKNFKEFNIKYPKKRKSKFMVIGGETTLRRWMQKKKKIA